MGSSRGIYFFAVGYHRVKVVDIRLLVVCFRRETDFRREDVRDLFEQNPNR